VLIDKDLVLKNVKCTIRMHAKCSNGSMLFVSLASIIAAVILVGVNFGELKSDDFDMIPLNSVLHGVKALKFPYNYVKIAGENNDKPMDIEEFIDWTFGWTQGKSTPSEVILMTGEIFTAATSLNLAKINKYSNVQSNSEFTIDVSSQANMKLQNKNYIKYAMGCVDWAEDSSSTATPKAYKLSIASAKTEACKCVDDHFTNLGIADLVSGGEDEKWVHKKIARTCAMRNSNKYVAEYAGTINTEHIMQVAFSFLFTALFMMLIQRQHPSRDNSIFETNDKNLYKGFIVGALVCGVIVLAIMTPAHGAHDTGTFPLGVDTSSDILERREYMGDSSPDDYRVTDDQMFFSTKNLLQTVCGAGFTLYGILSVLVLVCIYKDYEQMNKFAFDALMRFLVDVPVIVGLTLAGVSVLLQNGYTNYNYIDINVLLILSICFLQHISNLVKMFYDAVCRNTSSEVFKKIYFNDDLRKGLTKIENENKEEEEYRKEQTKKVTSVLQFFGWFRVWIFLLVTLGTVLFLTMTNELVKTTSLGNFFNSQVLVFAFVLYVTNVGYDVVRELLPVEFEKHQTDSTRFWVISLYIIFYSWNQYKFHESGALGLS
tara:strand:- start:2275 stop:4074 length:1800 start_codon:yes stop_codon:yes gene_type:complete